MNILMLDKSSDGRNERKLVLNRDIYTWMCLAKTISDLAHLIDRSEGGSGGNGEKGSLAWRRPIRGFCKICCY